MAILERYLSTYKGFSRTLWLLAGVTFIHRAGTMVLPFLATYLNTELAFTKSQIGTLLMYYGLGAVCGALLGGRLTDRLGYRSVIVASLIWSGIAFYLLQFLTDFTSLSIGFFALTLIAEAFRPALYVAVAAYSAPQSATRPLTLIRLAINLGVSIGPALAGLLVVYWGYTVLFWSDAIACLVAAVLFLRLPKPTQLPTESAEQTQASWREKAMALRYLTPFLFTVFCTSLLFFQLYHIIPLYNTEVLQLDTRFTGLLMGLNGLLICLFELPLVTYFDRLGTPKIRLILLGTALFSCAFATMLLGAQPWIVVAMVAILTFGVMFCSPFSNALVIEKAPKGYLGVSLGAYTLCIGLANVISSKMALELVHRYGYAFNFACMLGIGLVATAVLWRMLNRR